MKYNGEKVPDISSIASVRTIQRGKNRGKFQAIIRQADGMIHYGEPRKTKFQAEYDITLAQAHTGPVRVYVR